MNAKVIAQVDRKFILAALEPVSPSTSNVSTNLNKTLVLIDQHAASERVLIESLLQQLCCPTSASLLSTPLLLTIPDLEAELFRVRKPIFNTWGICYDIENVEMKGTTETQIRVRTLPTGISERCTREPRLLIDLLRTELTRPLPHILSQSNHFSSSKAHSNVFVQPYTDTNDRDWLTRINNCPQGLIDMLNSRACRSAIMFNDVLSKEQCETLVEKLAKCAFPFQCAHGRPSVVPVIELSGQLDMGQKEEVSGFGRAMRKWRDGIA